MKKFSILLLTALVVGFMLTSINLVAQDLDLATSGFVRSRFAFQVDDGSLFINEQMLSTAFDWRADTVVAHADFTLALEDNTPVQTDLRELYVDWYGDSFDLRIGKQKILWGKADGVFITDLVSPKDLSSFLTKDIGELRLGVTGIKFDYFAGPHQLEAVWLPLFTPTILPAQGSIWSVSPDFPVSSTMMPATLPESSLKNAEYFARYSYLGSLFDFQLMGGWFWNDTPAIAITDKKFTPDPSPAIASITITPEYYQVSVAGLAASLPLGPLVVKTEGAYTWNQRYQENMSPQAKGWVEKDSLQYLVGGDISFVGITFSLQWIQDIVLDYDDVLQRDEMINSMTAILQRTFNRETIKVELFSVINLTDSDAMIKPQLSWLPGNGFQASLGGWLFLGESGGSGQFAQYSENNGIYLSTAYYF